MYWPDDIFRASKHWHQIQALASQNAANAQTIWTDLLASRDPVAFAAVFDYFILKRPSVRFSGDPEALEILITEILKWLRTCSSDNCAGLSATDKEAFLRTYLEAMGDLADKKSDLQHIDHMLEGCSDAFLLEAAALAKAEIIPRISLVPLEAVHILPQLNTQIKKGKYLLSYLPALFSLPLAQPASAVIDDCLSGRYALEDQIRFIQCGFSYGSAQVNAVLAGRYRELKAHWKRLQRTESETTLTKYQLSELRSMYRDYETLTHGKAAILHGAKGSAKFWNILFESPFFTNDALQIIHEILNSEGVSLVIKLRLFRKILAYREADQLWIACNWLFNEGAKGMDMSPFKALVQRRFPQWEVILEEYEDMPFLG